MGHCYSTLKYSLCSRCVCCYHIRSIVGNRMKRHTKHRQNPDSVHEKNANFSFSFLFFFHALSTIHSPKFCFLFCRYLSSCKVSFSPVRRLLLRASLSTDLCFNMIQLFLPFYFFLCGWGNDIGIRFCFKGKG